MSNSPFFAAISDDDPLWVDIVPQNRELEFFRSPVRWIRNRVDADFPSTYVIHLQGPLSNGTPGMLLQGIAGTNVVALRPSLFQVSLLTAELREYEARREAATVRPWRVYVEDGFAATHTEIFPAKLDPDERAKRLRDHLFATASDPAILNQRLVGRAVEEHHRTTGGSYGSGTSTANYAVLPITNLSSVAVLYTGTEGSDEQACEAITADVQGRVILVRTSTTKDYLVVSPELFKRAQEEQLSSDSEAVSPTPVASGT
jgi:hypothetical protein